MESPAPQMDTETTVLPKPKRFTEIRKSKGSGITAVFLFAVVVVASGGFQYGYNVGVMNAPQSFIEAWVRSIWRPISTDSEETLDRKVTVLYSMIVAVWSLGGMVGALSTDMLVTVFGLKNAILFNNIFVFIGSILMTTAKSANNYVMLIIGRFVVGINSGLGAGLIPMYLTEISPISYRGAFGSSYQMVLVLSIMVAQLVGVDTMLGNEDMWPYLFIIIALVGIVQVVFLPFCPDSPRYLVSAGKEEKAKKALIRLRGTEDIDDEFEDMKKGILDEAAAGEVSFLDLFSDPMYRKPLVISIFVMVAQQFSGINAIIFYSTSTFSLANLGQISQYGTVLIGAVNVCSTAVSVAVVDKVGRKPLLIFAFTAMMIDTLLFWATFTIATSYNSSLASYSCIGFLMLYIIFFASGAGSIPWFLMSELFTQSARSKGVCLVIAVHWICVFAVGMSFPTIQDMMGPNVFLIFVFLQFVFLIYIIYYVPETKNKTIEEITAMFVKKKALPMKKKKKSLARSTK